MNTANDSAKVKEDDERGKQRYEKVEEVVSNRLRPSSDCGTENMTTFSDQSNFGVSSHS